MRSHGFNNPNFNAAAPTFCIILLSTSLVSGYNYNSSSWLSILASM
jgi:hypothetical protein